MPEKVGGQSKNDPILQDLRRSVENGDSLLMAKSIKTALAKRIEPEVIVNQGLAKGMETIGKQFDEGRLYLPQVLLSSNVMEGALKLLEPYLQKEGAVYRGTIIMGTVQGDIHEIGKNVCCAMLRGAGYRVIDLGPDVSPERFVEAVKEYSADIVGGSALMTTTLMMQKYTVDALKGSCHPVLAIFGGAPCSREWVEEIGGDGYSSSGTDIVALVNRLFSQGFTEGSHESQV